MAYSKTFLILALAFAVVLLISSEASARELAEAQESVQVNSMEDHHHHGHHHGHYHGHHHHHHHHCHGHHHCHHGAAGETLEVETEDGEN